MKYYSLLFFFLFSFSIETAARPKIGLVLSGGGAKGGAHIGVLKVLEENRVPLLSVPVSELMLVACMHSVTVMAS